MQLVQEMGSGEALTAQPMNSVTQSPPGGSSGTAVGDLNLLSQRQQQALLLLIGYLWMGLMGAALMTVPQQPKGGAATAAPAQLTQPAGNAPNATPPAVKVVKAVKA
jgi:hypothetical protein